MDIAVLAIVVTMGLMGGGLVALALMAPGVLKLSLP